MAWQRPGYVLQTVRSGCQLHLSLPIRQPSSLSSALLHPSTQKPQLQTRQRQFSTHPVRRNDAPSADRVESPAPAAPPIDFSSPAAPVPARIVPASPAYFSGSPKFIDSFLNIQAIRSRCESLPALEPSDAPRRPWLRLSEFRVKLNEEVPTAKYKRFIKVLQRLNRIHPDVLPAEAAEAMDAWLRPGNPYKAKPISTELDELGRSRGIGRRKESSATAWLVEGEGEVQINGKSLLQVFPRLHDRESALWALRSTSRLDKYNVWVLAQGGGVTGQAEAIMLAVARALMAHEPALKPILRRAGCITSDPRRVERKKPGHVKARKMPTWVKR
ncbi:37S ribosomal protein S9, mitochondrial [Arachnomyces sp. PD_36]|nr:37S ribosomal protein S9, mitochondrial [Arachnomyces sp. PD_36]